MAVFGRVLRAVMVVEGVVKSEEVTDGVDEEKTGIFCEISVLVALVVPIFAFFPYPASARACVVAA